MSNDHGRKFVINMIIGLIFTTFGIASIVYSCASKEAEKDWMLWAIIPIITINTGLLMVGRSVVHKVKSDLIRRQRQKSNRSDD